MTKAPTPKADQLRAMREADYVAAPRQRQPREKSNAYLDFIRGLPCVICGDDTTVEAAHVAFGDRRAGKRETGAGEKSSDRWALPLCGKHHREQHAGSEREFWKLHGIDPIFVALALHSVAGDAGRAGEIIEANRGGE